MTRTEGWILIYFTLENNVGIHTLIRTGEIHRPDYVHLYWYRGLCIQRSRLVFVLGPQNSQFVLSVRGLLAFPICTV